MRREQVRAAITAAAEHGEPYAPPRPPAGGYGEPAPKQKRLWWRFLLGSFLIVLSFASATTAASVLEIESFIDDVKPIPGIDDLIASVEPGEPQTFLLLGSDRRLEDGAGAPGLSDTTILLRLDPDKERIAILNIPRDLKVEIPGYGTDKFNAAYAYGGPKLTLKTIRSMTSGTPLTINHVVNIDFLGFAQAINAIDCVYIDVDRDYFHSNVGVPAELQYDEIDIDPGYQRLCGSDALDYARYRHTDTDLVRAARQQDFLREARSRVPPIDLFRNREELFGIFAEHTQSDIQEPDEAIAVIRLMIGSIDSPIEEVRFPATLEPELRLRVAQRHRGRDRAVPRHRGDQRPAGHARRPAGRQRHRGRGRRAARAPGSRPLPELENREPEPAAAEPEPEDDGLVDADVRARGGEAADAGAVAAVPGLLPAPAARGVDLRGAARLPRQRDSGDDSPGLPDGPHGPAARRDPLLRCAGDPRLGDPPILCDPSETLEMDGREYDVFVEGDRVRIVAWHENGNSYWVSEQPPPHADQRPDAWDRPVDG